MGISNVNSLNYNFTNNRINTSFKGIGLFNKIKEIHDKNEIYENTSQMGGKYNFVQFKEKFSDETVEEINKTRKIPEGYSLRFEPKTTTTYYNQDGIRTRTLVTPPTYYLVKEGTFKSFCMRDAKKIDNLPDGYKVMNDEKYSYIVKEDDTLETLKAKKTKKTALNIIWGSIIAATTALMVTVASGILKK